jgi:hypothetical protein
MILLWQNLETPQNGSCIKRKGLVSRKKTNGKSPFQVDYIKSTNSGQGESAPGPPPVLCEAPGPARKAFHSDSKAVILPFVKHAVASFSSGSFVCKKNITNNINILKNHFSNFFS